MKTCTKCHIEKDEREFNKCKANKDGLQRWCNECRRIVKNEWIKNNTAHVKEYGSAYGKKYRLSNAEKFKKYARIYYESNKEALANKTKEWYMKNKDAVIKRISNWQKENKNKRKAHTKKYRDNNKEKSAEYAKTTKVKMRQKEYIKRRVDNLHDDYIKMLLIKWNGVSKEDVEKMPFLLDKKKLDILVIRINKLIKQKQNEKGK